MPRTGRGMASRWLLIPADTGAMLAIAEKLKAWMRAPGCPAGHFFEEFVAFAEVGQLAELGMSLIRFGNKPIGSQGNIVDDLVELGPQRKVEAAKRMWSERSCTS